MPGADQIRSAVMGYVDSFNQKDRAKFLSVLADDVRQIDPVGSTPNVGRPALAAFWDKLYEQSERIEFRVVDLVVTGDEAALVFHITQVATGSSAEIDGIDVFQVDDGGRIKLIKGYSDQDHVKLRGGG